MNKGLWLNNLMIGQNGNEVFRRLIEDLSGKELRILRRNQDLIERVTEISRMSVSRMLDTLKEDYSLEIHDCDTGEIWVDASDVNKEFSPEWTKSEHSGWFLEFDARFERGEHFDVWATRFLMKEVRINIWLRYMEYKKLIRGRADPHWEQFGGI